MKFKIALVLGVLAFVGSIATVEAISDNAAMLNVNAGLKSSNYGGIKLSIYR